MWLNTREVYNLEDSGFYKPVMGLRYFQASTYKKKNRNWKLLNTRCSRFESSAPVKQPCAYLVQEGHYIE